MSKMTRREFLIMVSMTTGAVVLDQAITACAGRTQTFETTQKQSPQIVPAVQNKLTATGQPDKGQFPDLVVTRQGTPEELTRRAIQALGGMNRFVPQGANVIVKPNICVAYNTYEYASTTNPWVVGALVKMCYEAGASKVKVMDFPFGGTPEEAYSRSGIAEQVAAAGGEMVTMARLKYSMTNIEAGKDLKEVLLYKDALNTDVLINVPIAKHHSLARLTLGMKNLMGLMQSRYIIHQNIGQRLADLTSVIRPTLTVVDAVRILMANGPTGGNLDDVKEMNTVIASQDIVATDSYATSLFDLKPEDLDYIQAGKEMGLGESNLKNLRIEELVVDA